MGRIGSAGSHATSATTFVISRSTAEGTKLEHYTPSLLTYEVRSAKVNGERQAGQVTGTLILFDQYIQASVRLQGRQWELAPAMRPGKREEIVDDYVLSTWPNLPQQTPSRVP